jgi:hypothetical protein
MKRSCGYIILFLSLLHALTGSAQVHFKTVVPQTPIVLGEPFQVQYIVENAIDVSDFSSPAFPEFKFVTGPYVYSGNTMGLYKYAFKNMVITLVPIHKGRFTIHGAGCMINGKFYKSNDAAVEVISQKEADALRKTESASSAYFLQPGEDPFKKIHDNLFLKIVVDRYNCVVGEPLVASFKLYSRLQSRSDIVKNPGFYGFSVYDMINVSDKVQSPEKLNDRWFDVHTIRKVQLYPLQAGIFTIDPMELTNKVEFSRNMVNKKTEQQIAENMYGKDEQNNKPDENTEVYETNLKTEPVTITVKPLPGKNATDSFAGAVGNFLITAVAEKDTLLGNEESALIINIRGQGNFQRVSAPGINWPEGIESFEPAITDSLDIQQVPLNGQRSFKYVFVSDKPGVYTIPSIPFSFFNIQAKKYKTVATRPISFFISNKNKAGKTLKDIVIAPKQTAKGKWWLAVIVLMVMIVTGLFVFLKTRQRAVIKTKKEVEHKLLHTPLSIEELFVAPGAAIPLDDKSFYKALSHAIWSYISLRMSVSGSEMNKTAITNIFTGKGIEPALADELVKILHQCEAGVYTTATIHTDKTELLNRAKKLLKEIENSFSA